MSIEKLIVLNGGEGDYEFVIGHRSQLGIVTKIRENEKKLGSYIVFIEGHREIDITTDRILVVTKY
jgi:hypothetical protein